MSRSGYSDDIETRSLNCWRGAVLRATRGARGQKLIRDLIAQLDAMEKKELIANSFQVEAGSFCTLGTLGAARGIDFSTLGETDRCGDFWVNRHAVARAFDAAPALVAEIMYENDEAGRWDETPAQRWLRMRNWLERQLFKEESHA